MKTITIIDNSIEHQIAATGQCVQIADFLDGHPLPTIIVSRSSVARLLAAILAVMEEEGEE